MLALQRILIVGLGSIGKRHAQIAKMLMPDVQIAVLRHSNCEKLPDKSVDQCFTCQRKALLFAPQIAVISNPATYHLKIALSLAQAGVHLLVEKPIAAIPKGVEELIAVCQANGLVLMTAYNLRFLPSLQHFRELLASEIIGKVLSVRAEVGQYLPSWRPEVDYRDTVSARADLGGGVLLELSHEIDYLRWLFGEVRWVSAILSTQSDMAIEVEDTVHLTLAFMGKRGEKPLLASLNMDCIRHDSTRTCVAIGQQGTLRWDGTIGIVELLAKGSSSWQKLYANTPQRDDSYKSEWQHFLACVQHRTRPLISGQDGLAVLEIIQAARRSSERKTVVQLG